MIGQATLTGLRAAASPNNGLIYYIWRHIFSERKYETSTPSRREAWTVE